MADPSLFPKAAGIGVTIAAPVGQMSLLCMRRTLTYGWRRGLTTALGVTLGDASYAVVAACDRRPRPDLSRPQDLLDAPRRGYGGQRLGAGVAARSRDRLSADADKSTTIVMFAAVFTALAPSGALDPADAAVTIAGVLAGSLAWWSLLVPLVAGFGHSIGRRVRRWIDRVAGATLAAFGLAELRSAT